MILIKLTLICIGQIAPPERAIRSHALCYFTDERHRIPRGFAYIFAVVLTALFVDMALLTQVARPFAARNDRLSIIWVSLALAFDGFFSFNFGAKAKEFDWLLDRDVALDR